MKINSNASATDIILCNSNLHCMYVFVPKLHAGMFLTFFIRKQFSSTFPVRYFLCQHTLPVVTIALRQAQHFLHHVLSGNFIY